MITRAKKTILRSPETIDTRRLEGIASLRLIYLALLLPTRRSCLLDALQ
jgi:hypothetical protein